MKRILDILDSLDFVSPTPNMVIPRQVLSDLNDQLEHLLMQVPVTGITPGCKTEFIRSVTGDFCLLLDEFRDSYCFVEVPKAILDQLREELEAPSDPSKST
jgi:hypothetical protein